MPRRPPLIVVARGRFDSYNFDYIDESRRVPLHPNEKGASEGLTETHARKEDSRDKSGDGPPSSGSRFCRKLTINVCQKMGSRSQACVLCGILRVPLVRIRE
jgi:hypothetical protein